LNHHKTMTIFSLPSRLIHALVSTLIFIVGALSSSVGVAQVVYGIGDPTGVGTTNNALHSINTTTGAATRVCPGVTFPFTSAAIGVSNFDGLVYAIGAVAAGTASPIQSLNPVSCTLGPAGITTQSTQGSFIRAASCPDGRFYIMGTGTNFFEITPTTGATLRTLTFPALTTIGSGDFSCASNGNMYVIATDGVANYNLYTAASALFQAVPSGTAVALTNLGDVGLATIVNTAPNGIAEAPAGTVGCAAAPAPCFVISTGGNSRTWSVNANTAVATDLGATGGPLITDLSRSFPVDVSTTKSVTPTVALQGQTVVYTLTMGNAGPAVVRGATVTDALSPAFASAVWSCSVVNAGSATLVTTACGAASGTGSINTTASFSTNGSLIYRVTATLSSTFTGTLTNVAVVAMPGAIIDSDLTNNASTVTSTVSPATALSISKTNGTTTVVAGQTTSYTVTVSNLGPGNAPNSIVKDPASAGLSCTSAACTTTGTATCPVGTPNAIMTALQSVGGAIIPTFNAAATVTFVVTCGVTATGQ
jgi:uncharacterized repeat protein (TIGR01451 family)